MSDRNEEQRIDVEIHRTSDGSDPFSSAVRATRMPMLITDPRQPDNPIVFVNDAFRKLTGYEREETLGRNCRFLQGPGTNTSDVARIRDAIARRVPIEIDLLNYRKDGSSFWNRLLISPVFDGGELTYYFASQFDITPEKESMSRLAGDRAALESELHNRILDLTASEERLRFALNAGRLGSWTLDLGGSERLVASAICKAIFGRGAAEPFTYDDLQAAILPADLPHWRSSYAEALAGDGALELEFRARLPDGDIRWVEFRGQVYFRADGSPLNLVGVCLDITLRKQAEEHRDLLTREMDHRVKNTLATVQSIFSQTLRHANSLEEANSVIAERVQALAGAHDVLIRQGWSSATLGEIVGRATAPFLAGGPARIHTGGPDVVISPRAATALSLALHELATNAVKYGALASEAGTVIINWSIEAGRFTLVWQELGGSPVTAPTRKGFGSRMIEQALAASLMGQAEVDYRPTGVVFTLSTEASNLLEPEMA